MTSLRILFVDDNELVRRSLVRVLCRGGHEVIACGTPEEALVELDRWGSFDLVLADFDLGHATSDALLAEIRRRVPAARVMILTAAPRQTIPSNVPCIHKPIAAAELLRAILPNAA
jgi:CheY-like chemotaxis protein